MVSGVRQPPAACVARTRLTPPRTTCGRSGRRCSAISSRSSRGSLLRQRQPSIAALSAGLFIMLVVLEAFAWRHILARGRDAQAEPSRAPGAVGEVVGEFGEVPLRPSH
jgi:hypothetical protein